MLSISPKFASATIAKVEEKQVSDLLKNGKSADSPEVTALVRDIVKRIKADPSIKLDPDSDVLKAVDWQRGNDLREELSAGPGTGSVKA